MTRLLKQAFEEASRLAEREQDVVARWLLDELASQRRWDDAFAKSSDPLGRLAAEALNEHRSGRTKPLDAESL